MSLPEALALPAVQQALLKLLTDGFKTRVLFFSVTISGRKIRSLLSDWAGFDLPDPVAKD